MHGEAKEFPIIVGVAEMGEGQQAAPRRGPRKSDRLGHLGNGQLLVRGIKTFDYCEAFFQAGKVVSLVIRFVHKQAVRYTHLRLL